MAHTLSHVWRAAEELTIEQHVNHLLRMYTMPFVQQTSFLPLHLITQQTLPIERTADSMNKTRPRYWNFPIRMLPMLMAGR